MIKSAYIHIPFCKSKCKYCSFISFTNEDKKKDYINSLLEEIDLIYQKDLLKTLYFGGGTPSLLQISDIKKITDKFLFYPNPEITLELNPDDATEDYLKSLIDCGINRLSIGSQTFDNKILKLIGRRHSAEQTVRAVEMAKKVGFKNISVDLIYGLPETTSITQDLEIITELDVQHVSTYGLKIEEGSYFFNHTPANIPDDDTQADMYLEINSYLEANDYKRYEISNFAKPGFESRHNLNYWNNEEYYGFGVAAHGYINNKRYSNFVSLDKYINNPQKREFEHCVMEEEKIQEEIFLGFRRECGINIQNFNNKFKINFEKEYKNILKKYETKYIKKTKDGYKLTIEGVLLSNNILADFL